MSDKPKYKCGICGMPLRNPMVKVTHEKKCAKEHNVKLPSETDKIIEEVKPLSVDSKEKVQVKTPKKVAKDEIQEANELLSQYPVIADLQKDVEALEGMPAQIAGLYNGIDQLKIYISNLTTRTQQDNTPPPEKKEEIRTPGNPQVSDALKATTNLMKQEKAINDRLETSPKSETSKIEELRKQTDVNQGDGKPQQVNLGTPNPAPGVTPDISGMPDWVQKMMAFGTIANQFLPILQTLKGGGETQPAQTNDDMRILERAYANMTGVFTGALRLTQTFRQEARKEIIDELKGSYEFVPKKSLPNPNPPPRNEEISQEGTGEGLV